MIKRNVIFTAEDPWFRRITARNEFAMEMQKVSKVLNKGNGYTTNKFVYNMCHNLETSDELYEDLTKNSFSILLGVIKEVVTDDVFIKFNGPWFEKLLSHSGLPEADFNLDAKIILAELFYHSIMVMWFDNDYEIHKVKAVKYTTYYWAGQCDTPSCRSQWPIYYWVFYKVRTSLELKGELTQGELRDVGSVEVGQLFNTVYGFHLKMVLSRITNLNEFTFAPLPPLDVEALTESSNKIIKVAEDLTVEMEMVNSNTRQINTLLTSGNFSTQAINIQINEVKDEVLSNTTLELNKVKDKLVSISANNDGRSGSVIDFIQSNSTNTIKNVALQGKFIWDAIKDGVGYIKNRKDDNKVKFNCSICKAITAKELLSISGASFMVGMVLGYSTKKYQSIKSSTNKKFEIDDERLIDGIYYHDDSIDDKNGDYNRQPVIN